MMNRKKKKKNIIYTHSSGKIWVGTDNVVLLTYSKGTESDEITGNISSLGMGKGR